MFEPDPIQVVTPASVAPQPEPHMDANSSPDLNFFALIDAGPDGESLTTTSLRVAQVHTKRHDDLLRLIRKRFAESGAWGVRNFAETPYVGANGETYPMYTMSKDGYQFLVGRMTGEKAVEHQIAFIEAFNAMAALVKQKREGLAWRQARHELECKDSVRRASIHGKGLNERKQEIPLLTAEENQLRALSQPLLPGIVSNPQAGGALPNEAEPDPKS
jgi:Rha family phage regulatory protein